MHTQRDRISSPPSSVELSPGSSMNRRRTGISGGIAAVTASLAPPIGSPPSVIATALAPLLRDSTTRLLIGCLRAHDLIIVRRVALDQAATELLTALLPISEAPPGEFEKSRATEIARWHSALGLIILSQLRAETCAISAFQVQLALSRMDLSKGVVADMVEALYQFAFPGQALTSAQIARYSEEMLPREAADSVARILRHPNSTQLRVALAPLLEAVQSDIDILARLAKASLGLPS
jgi:hypothetical protein